MSIDNENLRIHDFVFEGFEILIGIVPYIALGNHSQLMYVDPTRMIHMIKRFSKR